jgi:hypothetical protein
MAKAKKSKAKKSKPKKTKAKKSAKKTKAAAAKRPAKKAKKKAPAAKAKPKKAAKKAAKPVKKKKQIVGEGDYAASKRFLKDQAGFVKRNENKIPAMAKEAEQALEGPDGAALRAAEEAAKSHSKVEGPEE